MVKQQLYLIGANKKVSKKNTFENLTVKLRPSFHNKPFKKYSLAEVMIICVPHN